MNPTHESVIEAENLCKQFGSRHVLDALDFTVKPGEIFGFVGPNGSGKTTTIRILLGLTKPSAGRCRVFGQVPSPAQDTVMQRIGAVLERPSIYERLSGWQNLRFAAALHGIGDKRIKQLLENFELWDSAHQAVSQYSKGMRQRLLLCRALLHDPELLILDEPTSGLDPASQRWMRLAIQDMACHGKTVFLSTHSLEEADQICHRVAVLYQGRLAALDTPAALKGGVAEPAAVVLLQMPAGSPSGRALGEVPWPARWLDGDRVEVTLNLRNTDWSQALAHLQELGTIVSVQTRETDLGDVYHVLTEDRKDSEQALQK